ncbi:MAG: flagellin lysine-N-methylase, partial [Anaerotignum sp.]|nr:flagellin lysine-N-methylase [Anaerotignum sp.]
MMMKLIAPDYYTKFQCIADRCRHSCCIGWVIDVDADTLEYYRSVEGALGERLKNGIDEGGETPHFILGEGERCPFLNHTGLCDLITELGEESLCQICTDHPRFRHFFADHTEIGLGLCCEEAGRRILGEERPMKLIILEDDGGNEPADPEEEELLALRESLFAMVQDRSLPIKQRMEKLLSAAEIDWTEWADFLLSLERLDERWAELLDQLPDAPLQPLTGWMEVPLEQLICSLLYRHLPGALEDGDADSRIRFCALMWQLIVRLCRQNGCESLEELVEY